MKGLMRATGEEHWEGSMGTRVYKGCEEQMETWFCIFCKGLISKFLTSFLSKELGPYRLSEVQQSFLGL